MYRAPHPYPIVAVLPVGAHFARAVVVRDAQGGTPTTLATEDTGSTTSSSAAPFFTSGGFVGQSDDDSERDVTKTALEWMFAIIAIVALTSLITWRYMQLRRSNQSLRGFFSRHHSDSDNESRDSILNTQERRQSLPRTTGLPRPHTMSGASVPVSTTFFYPPCLTHGPYPEPLEPAPAHLARSVSLPGLERGRRSGRRGRRAARGVDIDAQGRRGGLPDLDDWDGDDKDELPAYESVAVGGPPRYADVHYVEGLPVRVVTLPVSIPEEREEQASISPEVERERAVEQALRRELARESSRSPSPERHRALEPASDNPTDSISLVANNSGTRGDHPNSS